MKKRTGCGFDKSILLACFHKFRKASLGRTALLRFLFASLSLGGVPLLILSSCSIGGGLMTMNGFHDICLGQSSSQVIAAIGEPYSIVSMDDGTVEYEYIERIKVGYRDLEERRYIIVLRDGVVVYKKVKMSSPLPYGFDSYDMQTTQNGGTTPPQPETLK